MTEPTLPELTDHRDARPPAGGLVGVAGFDPMALFVPKPDRLLLANATVGPSD
jgi:hypothetical protein